MVSKSVHGLALDDEFRNSVSGIVWGGNVRSRSRIVAQIAQGQCLLLAPSLSLSKGAGDGAPRHTRALIAR